MRSREGVPDRKSGREWERECDTKMGKTELSSKLFGNKDKDSS